MRWPSGLDLRTWSLESQLTDLSLEIQDLLESDFTINFDHAIPFTGGSSIKLI
ncbi:10187_t:CDS:2 [Diversispora eburnea]|uniref:10187_t:CDS:1 n=1 Tax=Diversispora eburnea TaxID=1213867 RepID=A0A9N9BQA0_9GLOM|nr:10187_t:CDS:2 [Diversispora eburnea]